MNPVAIRLLNQQLICPQWTSPSDIVSHMGAMQAQDYRMMRWAVLMRSRRPSAEVFRSDYDSGAVIRLHLMRGTWQLVAGRDYWWMLRLFAPKAASVIKGWMSASRISIDDDELRRVRQILCSKVSELHSATKDDFVEALARQSITMDDHRLSYHIRFAELDGVLCSGSLTPMKATYSLAEEKIAHPVALPSHDEALALIARRYFLSHQPATFDDFVWWTGLNKSDCRRAIASLGSDLHEEKWHDHTFYLMNDCRTRGFRKGGALLLPPFDEYLIGYKSRDVVLAPDMSHHAHSNNGIFYPVVVSDGHVCGNWKPYVNKAQFSFFEHISDDIDLSDLWNFYQRFQEKLFLTS